MEPVPVIVETGRSKEEKRILDPKPDSFDVTEVH
jgi:hypothetical protein